MLVVKLKSRFLEVRVGPDEELGVMPALEFGKLKRFKIRTGLFSKTFAARTMLQLLGRSQIRTRKTRIQSLIRAWPSSLLRRCYLILEPLPTSVIFLSPIVRASLTHM